jgi:hypothetical protein
MMLYLPIITLCNEILALSTKTRYPTCVITEDHFLSSLKIAQCEKAIRILANAKEEKEST